MKLLTAALKKQLPKLYSTEEVSYQEKVAVAKFFFPSGRATWYAVEGGEYEGQYRFFGYVVSPLGPDCDEWGYFYLSELEGLSVRGLKVERDLYFKPTKMSEILGEDQ